MTPDKRALSRSHVPATVPQNKWSFGVATSIWTGLTPIAISMRIRPLKRSKELEQQSGSHERPQSQGRRRCALRLLECLDLSNQDWCQVAALLHDSDPEIAARAGAIALAVADRGNKELAVKRMINLLPTSDWLLQGEIQGWLEKHLDVALLSINEEIERREVAPASIRTKDHVL